MRTIRVCVSACLFFFLLRPPGGFAPMGVPPMGMNLGVPMGARWGGPTVPDVLCDSCASVVALLYRFDLAKGLWLQWPQ